MDIPLAVLLVEDVESDALLILRALRKAGYDVSHQRVATEGALRESLRQPHWELVLADYSLPGFSGRAALTLVQKLRADLPFILVSGAIGEDAAVAMMKAGAHDFVLKDNLARLGPAVERELREAEVRRAWRRAEQELREREARFRSIIENVCDMIIVTDRRGAIRYQSPSVERVLGHRFDDLVGRLVYDLVHLDDLRGFRSAMDRVAHEAESLSPVECRVRRHDQSWRTVEAVMTNFPGSPARQGLVFSFRDVTERKRLQMELVRTQRLESLGSLASGIAHDLNNLLTPITVAAELLEEIPAGSERQDLLEGMRVSADRAADLVQHLLSFARGVGSDRGTVYPVELARDLERLLRFSLPKKVAWTVDAPAGLWPFSGDHTQLLQVLVNLSVNARDAMFGSGRLSVEVENVVLSEHGEQHQHEVEPGPYVCFRVSDTGEGIPPHLIDQIFEPFFTTKERGQGTGLGLSTSLNIVQAHGGFIQVQSELGLGTHFFVYLPALATPKASDGTKSDDVPRGEDQLVLVVDEEEAMRSILKETLDAFGYQVLTATDGADALAAQSQYPEEIALAIVGTSMLLMDGPSTVRALRQVEPSLRIIVQTGSTTNSRQEFSADDVDEILERPYTTEQLLCAVARVLSDHPEKLTNKNASNVKAANHR